MSVHLSVTELAIKGKPGKRQEKKLLLNDKINCRNSTVGNSRQTEEKDKNSLREIRRSGILAQSPQ